MEVMENFIYKINDNISVIENVDCAIDVKDKLSTQLTNIR